jgi:plastocyanin
MQLWKRFSAVVLVVGLCIGAAPLATQTSPMRVDDVSSLLRSGIPEATIARMLGTFCLQDALSADAKARLVIAGATSPFLDRLAGAGCAARGTASSTLVQASPREPKTHVVKMLGDREGYRYDPADLTIRANDLVRFELVSGGPHNVAFDPASLSREARVAIGAGIPNPMMELVTQMLLDAGESVTISFAGVPPGTYEFISTPHLVMGQKGRIRVLAAGEGPTGRFPD